MNKCCQTTLENYLLGMDIAVDKVVNSYENRLSERCEDTCRRKDGIIDWFQSERISLRENNNKLAQKNQKLANEIDRLKRELNKLKDNNV